MNQKYANYLLHKTKDDYNLIGYDFSSKRGQITSDLSDLQKYAKDGDRILDLGCGNGRLVEVLNDLKVEYTGVDSSDTMISIAKIKYPSLKFQTIDFLNLPFPDNHFDKIYCLAVFHHIPSVEYRIKFLKEIRRTLKKDGQLILTVWNLLIKAEVVYLIIINTLKKIIFLNPLDYKDILLPFKRSKDNNLADRYLHCFTKNELSKLLARSGFELIEIYLQNRGNKVINQNICTIAQKK